MSCSNKRLVLFGLLVFCYQSIVLAQASTPFGLYLNNWKIINPAATGLSGSQEFNFGYRALNSKVKGHPSDVMLSYENQLSKLKSGVGLIFENQQIGITTKVYTKALYSYQFQLNEGKKLSVGMGLSYLSKTSDYTTLFYYYPANPIYLTTTTSRAFDMDFGVAYKTQRFQGGIGIRNLFKSKIEDVNNNAVRNYGYLTAYGQYKFDFSKIQFVPSSYLSVNEYHLVWDINPMLLLYKYVWLGGTYRITDGSNYANFIAGINLNRTIKIMGIVYSSGYQKIQPGTEKAKSNFEINMNIRLGNN